jgi:hypothetical protein
MLHSLTGLNCPGCGATRAVHALLHGDLRQALAYNVVFVFLLPLFVALAVRVWWAALRGKPVSGPRMPPWAIRAVLVIVLAFGILRNVSVYPFTLLAPHDLDRATATELPAGAPAEPARPAEGESAAPVGAARPHAGGMFVHHSQAEQRGPGVGPRAAGA